MKKAKGQRGYKLKVTKDQVVKKMHSKKQSFWSKATGGRMK